MRTRSDVHLSRRRPQCVSESSSTSACTHDGVPSQEKFKPDNETSSKTSSLKSVSHRQEIKVKTPKVKTLRGNKTLVQTPGRDDFLCSQHFDSQVVVGWDCNSPDTIRGIKRFTGEENGDVSDLVMQLIGDESDGMLPTKRNTPPLLGVWRESTEDRLLDDNLRARKKVRQRKRSGKESSVSKDLLNKLSLALDKCPEDEEVEKSENEELLQSDEESHGRLLNCSEDLFRSDTDRIVEKVQAVKPVRVSPRLLEKKQHHKDLKLSAHLTKIEKREEQMEVDVSDANALADVAEDWSDDELFGDDSFNVVKDTQVDNGVNRFISPVFGTKRKSSDEALLPKTKNTRYTFNQVGASECQHVQNNNFTSLQTKPPYRFANSSNSNSASLSKPVISNGGQSTNVNTKQGFNQKLGSNAHIGMNHASDKPVYSTNYISSKKQTTLTVPVNGQSFNNTQNFYPKSSYHSRPISSQNTSCASSLSKPSQLSTVKPSALYATSSNTNSQKPQRSESFKKHNSFSGSNSPKSSSRRRSMSGSDERPGCTQFTAVLRQSSSSSKPDCVKPSTSSAINTCDANARVVSTASCVGNIHGKGAVVHTSVVTTTAASTCTSFVSSTFAKPLPSIPEQTRYSPSTDGFDTSFSDELLCQLAEPDDLLDSQVVLNNTAINGPKSKPAAVTKLQVKQNQQVSQVPVKSTHIQAPFRNQILPSQTTDNTDVRRHETRRANLKPSCSSVSSTMGNCNKLSNTSNQTVKSVMNKHEPSQTAKQFKFRAGGAAAGITTRSVGASASSVPAAEAPKQHGAVQLQKKEKPKVDQFSEDLFTSDDDDDLLLDDDGLTEPQILAMLDEAEFLATQQQKMKAADQQSEHVSNLPAKRGSVHESMESCKTDSLDNENLAAKGQSSDGGSEPSGSQGSSQSKYSAEEIEKKKREAMERRKRKLEQNKAIK